jgi:hypothetical protein
MFVTAFALGLVASTPLSASDTARLQAPDQSGELAVAALSQGRTGEAISELSRAHNADRSDPAVLINLGIAHAHRGEDAAAHEMFRAAANSPIAYELETAEGVAIDSRKLARRAMKMLERGEFRRSVQPAGQLTLRD